MLGWWKGGKAFTRKSVEVLELIGTLVQVLQFSTPHPPKKKKVTNNPIDISCPNFVNKLKKMRKL